MLGGNADELTQVIQWFNSALTLELCRNKSIYTLGKAKEGIASNYSNDVEKVINTIKSTKNLEDVRTKVVSDLKKIRSKINK